MTSIFIDSSFFKGLLDPQDDFHQQALALFRSFDEKQAQLITTNYIVDETATLLRSKTSHQDALKFRDFLISGKTIVLERVTAQDDAAAWEWFKKPWSKLSFTDCTSFAVMKRLDLTDVATFDTHFAKAGFRIVKS